MVFLDTDFLESNEIKLVLEKTAEADPVRNWVPAYHFMICDKQGNEMGRCDLRIGYNDNLYYGGHIGYNTVATTMQQKHVFCYLNWLRSMEWNICILLAIQTTGLQGKPLNI